MVSRGTHRYRTLYHGKNANLHHRIDIPTEVGLSQKPVTLPRHIFYRNVLAMFLASAVWETFAPLKIRQFWMFSREWMPRALARNMAQDRLRLLYIGNNDVVMTGSTSFSCMWHQLKPNVSIYLFINFSRQHKYNKQEECSGTLTQREPITLVTCYKTNIYKTSQIII
jgi:hypothetical protein